MRYTNFKQVILIMIAFALFAGNVFAQPGGMKDKPFHSPKQDHFPKIPDLSEEQKEQIKKLKTDHLKAVLPLKNQMREKEAHLQTLSTGENVNMELVNKTIEEIGEIRTQLMKNKAAHRQQIRNLLSEEQRLFFDSRPQRKGMRQGTCGKHPQERMDKRDRF